jgi:hypothetical protein
MRRNIIKFSIYLFAVVLTLLVGTADLHHNHELTLESSEYCAVMVFQSVISAALLLFLILLIHTDLKSKTCSKLAATIIPKNIYHSQLTNRAPPQ